MNDGMLAMMQANGIGPALSVIIPVYNEAPLVARTYRELLSVLAPLDRSYETLWIDDGSTDGTPDILTALQDSDPAMRIVRLPRNTRKSGALRAGFLLARGGIVVTIDGDGQDDPRSLPDLLQAVEGGIDVAVGWRKRRADPLSKRLNSYLINLLASLLLRQRLHDMNTGFKAFSRPAADAVRFQGSLYRFVPHLLQAEGFTVREVPVLHRRRSAGKSKFTLRHRYRGLTDIIAVLFIAKCRKQPLKTFAIVGVPMFLLGLGIFMWLSTGWLLGQPIGARPLFFTSLFLMLAGIQITSLGFIGTAILQRHRTPETIDAAVLESMTSQAVTGALGRFSGREVHAVRRDDVLAAGR